MSGEWASEVLVVRIQWDEESTWVSEGKVTRWVAIDTEATERIPLAPNSLSSAL